MLECQAKSFVNFKKTNFQNFEICNLKTKNLKAWLQIL